jgi:hypothetical protein
MYFSFSLIDPEIQISNVQHYSPIRPHREKCSRINQAAHSFRSPTDVHPSLIDGEQAGFYVNVKRGAKTQEYCIRDGFDHRGERVLLLHC